MSTENQTVEISTLGDLLRQTREKKGLTVQQVSDYLFITPSIITAIEEDNRPNSINEVFWRGYIRSYAKHLHIEEQQLKAFYTEPAGVDLDAVQKMRDYSQREVRRKQIKWLITLTSVIVIVLLVIFVLWWHEHNKVTQPNVPSSSVSNTVTSTSDVTSAENNTADESTSVPLVVPPTEQSATTANAQTVPSTSVNLAGTITDNGVVAQQNSTTTALNSHNPSTEIAPTTSTTSAAVNPALQISFSGDCWIKVSDAKTQKVLYAGLQSAGDQLTFQQPSGYDLVIGAPSVTSVVYNGQSVDLTSYTAKNRVAKLSLSANN